MTTLKASDSTKQVKPAGKKPPAAGKGRRKGSQNKYTRELKDMILGALQNVGGVAYLERRANDPKTQAAFLGLVGKVLPMTVQGTGGNGAVVVEIVRFGAAGPAS